MSKIKNVARQVIFRQLKGSRVDEINRDPKHSFCMICKHSLGDDKIKRKFGSFAAVVVLLLWQLWVKLVFKENLIIYSFIGEWL